MSLLTAVGGGFDCIPLVPSSLFNGFAGVVHSLATWPQPRHLKHCRALGLSYFGHCPGHLLVLGYSTYFGKQWPPYLQQKSCEQGCSDPGQSNLSGSQGRQEYSCPSPLSHDSFAWDCLEH